MSSLRATGLAAAADELVARARPAIRSMSRGAHISAAADQQVPRC